MTTVTIKNPYAPGGAKASNTLDGGPVSGVRTDSSASVGSTTSTTQGLGTGPIPTGSVTGTMTNTASAGKAAQNAAAGYTSSSSSGSPGSSSSSGSHPSSLMNADHALQILNNAGTTSATSDNPNSSLPYSASPDSGLLLSPPKTEVGTLNSLAGSQTSGLDMYDSYRNYYDTNIRGTAGAQSFDDWMQSTLYSDNAYAPSLTKTRDAYNAYTGTTYKTPQEERSAWDAMVASLGLAEGQFQELYAPYLERVNPKPPNIVPGTTPAGAEYQPDLTSRVDAGSETIEGRIQNLLGTDASGNYTNAVVRQAADRALAAFARRGLLNSSMAQQAAIEAATSKAIEIAGPDAEKYYNNRRANVDANNQFASTYQQQQYSLQSARVNAELKAYQTQIDQDVANGRIDRENANLLQQNYREAINNITANYSNAITNIQNNANMTAEQKTAAIGQYEVSLQNQIDLTNDAFDNMVGWQNEWKVMLPEILGTTGATSIGATPKADTGLLTGEKDEPGLLLSGPVTGD
jgi:hypothetical protein